MTESRGNEIGDAIRVARSYSAAAESVKCAVTASEEVLAEVERATTLAG
jgi:hypothetical protein